VGFRAPELLSEEAKYSNKVDIWALACILYQLCTNKPLFLHDFAVHEFVHSNGLNLSKADIPNTSRAHFTACLQEMLVRNPQSRPSASLLKSIFDLYFIISDPIYSEIPSSSTSYVYWRHLVSNTAVRGPEDIAKLVVDWFLSQGGKAVDAVEPLLKAPVDRFYQLTYLQNSFWCGTL
jgi:serine/threonine protein kinase